MTAWRAHIGRYGTAALPGEPWMRWTLMALLLLGGVLRFWDLPHLPYTHDELSALVRIYPTLSETVSKGVMELDTHPPGVQVFEWLWTKLFSMREADVKLPFIIMGLLSIVLLYRFALAWTGAGAALMLATLLATLQYTVFYSQLARPYAAGLFTTALLADQLTRYLAFGERRMLIGAGIAIVLSAYVHHFSLLLATLMALTGLLLVGRERRKAYVIMCFATVLLYLPNVPIILHQLGQGGLAGWLPPPGDGWLADYAAYVSHWSMSMGIGLVVVVLASITLVLLQGGASGPARWFLLLWGIIPLAVGYAYSVWRAPVLQYSVILFSFPYLVLFVLQGVTHLPRKSVLVACLLMSWASVLSLVDDRKHYTITYHSKYAETLRAGMAAVAERGAEHVLVLTDIPGHMEHFYRAQWGLGQDRMASVNVHDGWSQARFDSLLLSTSTDEVVYGRSNGAVPEHLAVLQQHFPRLIERTDLVEGQVFRFSRVPIALQRFDADTVAHAGSRMVGDWSVEPTLPLLEGGGWDYSGREYGILIELPLDSVVNDPGDQLEIIARLEDWTEASDVSIIADVHAADSTVFYRGGDLEPRHRAGGAATVAVTVSPSDMPARQDLTLRAYVYSRDKGPLHVRSVTVMRREVNRVRDAVLRPVPWLGRFPPE